MAVFLFIYDKKMKRNDNVMIVMEINKCDWQLDSVVTTCSNLFKRATYQSN